jgi:D-glycero-D-manno-heptose 1,7-bisphosphate phosphatase
VAAVRRAVFLDRDGTLIREVGYLRRMEDVAVLPGAAEALRRLGEAGFLRLVVTNQSGVARKYVTREFVDRVNETVRDSLQRGGGDVEGFYVCPHHPEYGSRCSCRKPDVGLLLRAAEEWDIEFPSSWVVGDKVEDVELARRAGCRSALVRTGYGRESETRLAAARGVVPDVIADDLGAVVEAIVRT